MIGTILIVILILALLGSISTVVSQSRLGIRTVRRCRNHPSDCCGSCATWTHLDLRFAFLVAHQIDVFCLGQSMYLHA